MNGYGQVSLSSTLADFQLIRENSQRYVDIEAVSRSDRKEYIFRMDAPDTYAIIFSNKTLENGQKEHIRIKFNPKNTGYFEHTLLLHVSSSDVPMIVKTKGYVEQLPKDTNPDCPSFEYKNVTLENSFQLTAEVVDERSKLPIPGAEIILVRNGSIASELITGESGIASKAVPLGLYYFIFSADGYLSEEFASYVNKTNDYVYAELQQLEKSETEELSTVVTASDSIVPTAPDSSLFTDTTEFPLTRFASNNIVFCIDISASMKYTGKLDLLKASMVELTEMLRQVDNVTIVTYASEAEVLMETTSAADKVQILDHIERLEAKGYTAGVAGMKLAYSKATDAFISAGNNQVIMVTDGGFNRGKGSARRLARKYARKRIKMSVVGIKNTAIYERSMRDVAKSGEGNFVEINTYDDARSALKAEIKSQSAIPFEQKK